MMTQIDPEKKASHFGFGSKRLMSLLGFVPLGMYVILHLWTNLSSLGGPLVYNQALLKSRNHPAFIMLEILLGIVILIHMVIGIKLTLRWRSNTTRVRYFSNLKFALQRLSGIGLGLFIMAHVVKARILPSLHPPYVETWLGMHHALWEPITLAVYVLGLLAVSFHLANGLWTFCMTWGLTVTPTAQRRVEWMSVVFFVVLMIMAGLSLYGFMQPVRPEWLK